MKGKIFASLLLTGMLAAMGCATTYDSTVPASTGVGAAAGALLGYGLTGKATGAAAGAGAGALAGALTGVVIDESRRAQAPPPPPPAQSAPPPQPPPPAYTSAPQAYVAKADPTQGQLINNTRWRLEVFVDDEPEPIRLTSQQHYPLGLDVGEHRITARAFVQTQFGERLVGTFSRSLYIDPKGAGWTLRFDEGMF